MKTLLFLRQQATFEEHEERIKEGYKEHAEKYGYKNNEYYYPYAYGSLKSAYEWLYEDYLKLKEEHDQQNAD